MAAKECFLFVLVVLHAATLVCSDSVLKLKSDFNITVNDFPRNFIFGAATAAYQIEGAANEGGRGPSIWDNFTHQYPEKIRDGSNGDVAVNSYHLYKEDVRLLSDMRMNAYRFSISWSRILPHGNLRGGVNREGINYYKNLINELVSKGMRPFATLFHWDAPQALEDKYGGFLSREIVADFMDFAEVCFQELGDVVKHWITLNEPYAFSFTGYTLGTFAPGRCSQWVGNCSRGDSGTEPYIVTHNMLLAHAAVVQLYRNKYQARQKGIIGITHLSHWFIPDDPRDIQDRIAAQLALDFMYGWFMDPITRGDYPASMRDLVRERLPQFTEWESYMLKGSYDFIGVNYYTGRFTRISPSDPNRLSYMTDSQTLQTPVNRLGIQIGPQATGSSWIYVYAQGLRDLLVHTAKKYNNPLIFITENGVGESNIHSSPTPEALNDTMRLDYYQQHLSAVLEAIRAGVNIQGYFAWSLMDNFEWADGFTTRFGLHFVDFENEFKRTPKLSAQWFRTFLSRIPRYLSDVEK